MAGFVALAAGALLPSVADSISMIFSKVAAAVDEASETGSRRIEPIGFECSGAFLVHELARPTVKQCPTSSAERIPQTVVRPSYALRLHN
jgi:hypothetical protein